MDGHKRRQKILIVDDSEMNRSILVDMLGEEYDTIEVENGLMAVNELQKQAADISLVMLDIVMPEMDGFGVLAVMNQRRWIESIPVIMISAETTSDRIDQGDPPPGGEHPAELRQAAGAGGPGGRADL